MCRVIAEEADGVKLRFLVDGAGVGVGVELALPPAIEDPVFVGVQGPGLRRLPAAGQGHHRGALAIGVREQPRQVLEGCHGVP